MSAIIEARGVTFRVDGRALVDQADLRLESGRLTIVIGPNGAGKSTLLSLLAGAATAHAGEISYCGERLDRLPPWRIANRRAVMTQSARLAFPFTVHEVASLGLDIVGRASSRQQRRDIVARSLAAADALHLCEREYSGLSGGEQQRVQFARALCQLFAGRSVDARQALLLDEPIASLDLRHQLALMDAARDIADAGAAVFVVLHDLNIAAAYADELVVMSGGRIMAAGRPGEILSDSLVASVFGVDLQLSAVPPSSLPFLLPHGYARRRDWSRTRFREPMGN
ncbi:MULTISPECIES: heme ABC transporter ATP-binding protein [Methylosinus]|uniref:Heme ABC transporter ATP-binding protein n=1 Tax=Methylosinus trichosporium (strain ATCC 35070 / NCIMB 11131 / UNIQEM 75 / OB3b) TaxID=595536 RepID=A0A2D2D0Z5_METT3|nr:MULTISPECIES: heme ABC transporter ATP-binding protein [Methylosinus]ATQ68642.1 heme ABC transporter ATP-binding protein [Methylosinus trichosporium OB3b]OBS53194.1 iron ABC transporter [Methylosinus sp. 3S-1]